MRAVVYDSPLTFDAQPSRWPVVHELPRFARLSSSDAAGPVEDAQADIDALNKQANAMRAKWKAGSDYADKMRIEGQASLPSSGTARATAESALEAKLRAAAEAQAEADKAGASEARANLTKLAGVIGPALLLAFPPAGIAFAAAVAVCLTAIEVFKAIGLEHLRVGRARDAYTDDAIASAAAKGEWLRAHGIPFPMYGAQHVSPREYGDDYLQPMMIDPIAKLSSDVRANFNAGGAALKRWREKDPIVAQDYATSSTPPLPWIWYAWKVGGPSTLTYAHMSAQPATIVEMLTVAAMRDHNTSPAYFNRVQKAAIEAWNAGIDTAKGRAGGPGAEAFARAWFAADQEANALRGPSAPTFLAVFGTSAPKPVGTSAPKPVGSSTSSSSKGLPLFGKTLGTGTPPGGTPGVPEPPTKKGSVTGRESSTGVFVLIAGIGAALYFMSKGKI